MGSVFGQICKKQALCMSTLHMIQSIRKEKIFSSSLILQDVDPTFKSSGIHSRLKKLQKKNGFNPKFRIIMSIRIKIQNKLNIPYLKYYVNWFDSPSQARQ